MALGSTPKHTQDFQLADLDKEHFLVIAIETAIKLDWRVSFVSETVLIAYTKFSMSSWSEKVTIKIENGIASIQSKCTEWQLSDLGKNKKNIEAFLSKFSEVRSSMTPKRMEWKLTELRQEYLEEEDDDIESTPPLTAKEKITGLLSIFTPTEDHFMTTILLYINILIFIAMAVAGVNMLSPDNESLLNWGANFRPVTLEGQWWRLLTSCFLHIGIVHLLMNMYALLYIGILLEPYFGKTRFIAAYLLTGISASVTSLWWHDLTISAGASGAIFGMYGVFLALLTTNLLEESDKKRLLISITVFVGYNLLNGLQGGIDNAAHIGGLVSGLVIGYAFIPSLKKVESANIKFSTIGILSVIVIATSFTVYKNLPNDIGKYDEQMQRFASMESKALEVYNLSQNTPKEKLLSAIKDGGLYYWNENLKLIDSFKNLDLPSEIRARNNKLRAYCELRIKSYELIYKAIEEGTDIYKNEINDYDQKLEKIIDELTGSAIEK